LASAANCWQTPAASSFIALEGNNPAVRATHRQFPAALSGLVSRVGGIQLTGLR
jgi:hypothetical protein